MAMTDAAREAKNAYRRAWAKKNPDKVKAQQERFWERRAAEIKAQTEQCKQEDTQTE